MGEKELVFDGARRATNWSHSIEAPSMDPIEPEQYEAFDSRVVRPSMRRMVASIVSRVDIRDMLTAMAFFDVLDQLGPDALGEKASDVDFAAWGSHVYADPARTPNDFNALWREMGCAGKMDQVQVLRAICAVSLVCHSNRVWQENTHWFGDDRLKQLFNDPDAVLSHIHTNYLRTHVRRMSRRETQSIGFERGQRR